MTEPPNLLRRSAAAILVLAAAAAYAGGFSGPFVYDDLPSIRDNPSIRSLWALGSLVSPPQGTTVGGRPLLNASFALNHALSGTAVWSYHALNLLIHILAGLTLFGIVRRTLERAGRPRGSLAVSFAVSLIWIVHPLQTESVAYIVQRAESLMGLFYLLTLYCFIRGVEAGESGPREAGTGNAGRVARWSGWFTLALLSCLAGMATKEVMATAPLVVLLYDRTFVAGSFRSAWTGRRAVHGSLAATWLLLGALVAASGGNRGGTSGIGSRESWMGYALTQFEAVARYLGLSFWPRPLVFEYGPFWVADARQALPWALPLVLVAAGTAWALHRRPAAGFLGACFLAVLAPTSLVPGSLQMIAEHRMYLALAPVAVAAVLAVFAAAGRGGLIVCAAAAVGLGAATARRLEEYRTELALWTDTVAKRPENARARNNLGEALGRAGRIQEAIGECREAIRLQPGFAEAHYNLGAALLRAGRPSEAAASLQEAVRLRPGLAQAHDVLAGALLELGRIPDALGQYAEALRLEPSSFETRYNLGNALFGLGRAGEAADQYLLALGTRPDSVEANYNAGNALAAAGRLGEAIAHFQAALRLRPDLADAHFNLGDALARAGRTQEAVRQFEEVLRLEPGSDSARARLAELSGSQAR